MTPHAIVATFIDTRRDGSMVGQCALSRERTLGEWAHVPLEGRRVRPPAQMPGQRELFGGDAA